MTQCLICYLLHTTLLVFHRMDTVPVGHFDDSQLRPALRAKLRSSHEKQPLTRSEWSEVTSVIVSHEKVTNR